MVAKQTGGITESRQLPPEFIEAAQKTFLTDLTRQAGIPSITTATTQQPGETAEQFAQRQAQAQQFGITKAGMAELAPKVADETSLQQAASQRFSKWSWIFSTILNKSYNSCRCSNRIDWNWCRNRSRIY